MPKNDLVEKLRKAVDAQKAVQAASKGVKAEIGRLQSES